MVVDRLSIPLELILQTQLEEALGSSETVQNILSFPWQDWCSRWLQSLAADLPPASGYELALLLTDDAHIRDYNQQFRHQDKPTDVLAFAALEGEMPPSPWEETEYAEPLYLGDIIVSLERAAQQAIERGHDTATEVVWLVAHGFLHLLGWDHPDETTLTTMLSKQTDLLTLIGVNAPPFF